MPALPFRQTLAAGLLVAAPSALFVALPGALSAQTIITVAPQQCVWRAGDNPAWAAPSLDESGWQPYAQWKERYDEPRIWVRCHADLSSLRTLVHPAVQVALNAGYAYQLFVNGTQIGEEGNLHTGMASRNEIRQYPLPAGTIQAGPGVVALRITLRFFEVSGSPLEVHAGDPVALSARRAEVILANSAAPLANAVGFALIGAVGLMLLGLFYYDRSRRELLYLSIECLSLALLRINEFCAAAQVDYSSALGTALNAVGTMAGPTAHLLFCFALVRRRVPQLYWLPAAFIVLDFAVLSVLPAPFLSPGQSLWLSGMISALNLHSLYPLIAAMAIAAAPFVAFWPYGKIAGRMRPLAVLCILWAAVDLFWYAVELTLNPHLGLPNLFFAWRPELLGMRAIVTAGVLVALLALLFHDQRRVTQERALLAGEMEAARNVQHYLIPEQLPPTPGFSIESEYRPAREVGGDFFQVLPRAADGSVLIVVGDVAGKGIEAGMLATLIVGSVRTAAAFTSDPPRILALLNERLCGRGLVTCLALRIEQDGSATLVNAGHLPPYLNGRELAIEGALPLGAVAGMKFPTFNFRLAAGDSMMLMTDGVVEAQNEKGQLFGFDRTAALSRDSAQNMADAAQRFGQQDDITVLTLKLVSAGAAGVQTRDSGAGDRSS
ncbi:MAG: PP2C family protein-serine/threonine phosphatase [Terracidiphilus sp.]